MNKVSVVGSINYDTTIQVKNFPLPGETILAKSSSFSLGGKGANQAAALAKMGLEVFMVGAVGEDKEGNEILEELNALNINTENVSTLENISTGKAQIVLDENANNNIIVIPGSNSFLTREVVDQSERNIASSDAVLAQLEIPLDIVQYAFELAKKYNKLTVLNPAPAQFISEELYQFIDIFIPNEVEIAQLYGKPVLTHDELEVACQHFVQLGVKTVIVTLGEKGCYYYNKGIGHFVESYLIEALDTTGAGDSFIGGFLGNYLETNDIHEAINYGQKVASCTVSRYGAIKAIPTKEEVSTVNFKKVTRI